MTAGDAAGRCEDVRGDLSELALGILTGRDRSSALAHLSSCPRCQAEVERLSSAADAVVQLAPSTEPPVGFEVRLFDRLGIEPPAPTALQRGPGARWLRPVLAVVGVAALVLVVAFGVSQLAAPNGSPRAATADHSGGSALSSAPLVADGKRLGEVRVYGDDPPAMFMTVADVGRRVNVTCEVTTLDGRTVAIGSFRLAPGGYGAWGATLPVPADQVRSARLVDAAGAVVAAAVLNH